MCPWVNTLLRLWFLTWAASPGRCPHSSLALILHPTHVLCITPSLSCSGSNSLPPSHPIGEPSLSSSGSDTWCQFAHSTMSCSFFWAPSPQTRILSLYGGLPHSAWEQTSPSQPFFAEWVPSSPFSHSDTMNWTISFPIRMLFSFFKVSNTSCNSAYLFGYLPWSVHLMFLRLNCSVGWMRIEGKEQEKRRGWLLFNKQKMIQIHYGFVMH